MRGNQFDLLQKLTRAAPGQLNVLCHCDMWVNNLLFNGASEEDSTDVKFIDYQISEWASPAVDVLHSIFNSCKPQTIVEEFDDLVEFYYSQLSKALQVLKCKVEMPSLEDFVKAMNGKGSVVPVYAAETISLAKADSALKLDLEDLTDPSEEAIQSRREIFSGPEFIETMNLLLPFLDKRGFLEFKESNLN